MSRKLLAPSDSICRWEDIDFRIAEYRVKKLQKQIATAYKCNNSKTVTYLQRKMINSFYAKALAVRRVTSNRGKKLPALMESPGKLLKKNGMPFSASDKKTIMLSH